MANYRRPKRYLSPPSFPPPFHLQTHTHTRAHNISLPQKTSNGPTHGKNRIWCIQIKKRKHDEKIAGSRYQSFSLKTPHGPGKTRHIASSVSGIVGTMLRSDIGQPATIRLPHALSYDYTPLPPSPDKFGTKDRSTRARMDQQSPLWKKCSSAHATGGNCNRGKLRGQRSNG